MLGIAEIELDLKTQAGEVCELGNGQVQVGAEQDGMGMFAFRAVGLDEDDDVERVGKVLVQGSKAIGLGRDLTFGQRVHTGCSGKILVIQFISIA